MAAAAASTSALGAASSKAAAQQKAAAVQFMQGMQTIGIGMVAVGGAIAGGFALAGKAAIDFESSFAGVRKTVNATEAEFSALSQGLRDMAKEIPVNVNELNAIAEAAGQLGIKKDAILGFTETIAKLGVTTDLVGEQGAKAFARIANIMQTSQGDFDRMGATIVALGNAGASTESEIAEMSLRIAGAGHQIGLSEAEVLSFANALSSVGIRAESGGSAISRTFIEMAKSVADGGKKLKDFAAVADMSATEFARLFKEDAAGATVAFIEGLDRISQSGGNVFAVLDNLGLSEVRVRDALLRAAGAGDLFRESLELGSDAWKENSALNEEAAKRFDTTASKIQLAKNEINDLAISVGNVVKGAIEVAAQALGGLAAGINDLPGPIKAVVVGLTAAAGAVLLLGGGLLLLLPRLVAVQAAMASLGMSGAGMVSSLAKWAPVAGVALAAGLALNEMFVDQGLSIEDARKQMSDLNKQYMDGALSASEYSAALFETAFATHEVGDAIPLVVEGLKDFQRITAAKATAGGLESRLPHIEEMYGGVRSEAARFATTVTESGVTVAAEAGRMDKAIREWRQNAIHDYSLVGGVLAAFTSQDVSSSQDRIAATQAVEDAERSLADAQSEVIDAQEALTEARDDARITLEALRLEVERQWMTEERALMALREARKHLREVEKDDHATKMELRDAELAVIEAEWALHDVRKENRDRLKELNEAERKGINGAENVVSAQEAVRDAQKAVLRAAEALTEAVSAQREVFSHTAKSITAYYEAMFKAQQKYGENVRKIIADHGAAGARLVRELEEQLGKTGAAQVIGEYVNMTKSEFDRAIDIQRRATRMNRDLSEFMAGGWKDDRQKEREATHKSFMDRLLDQTWFGDQWKRNNQRVSDESVTEWDRGLEKTKKSIFDAFTRIGGVSGDFIADFLRGISGVREGVGLEPIEIVRKKPKLYKAKGGMIPGQGSDDSVPAMLTPGEYVLRKDAVAKYGVRALEGLNQGLTPTEVVWGGDKANPGLGYRQRFKQGGPVLSSDQVRRGQRFAIAQAGKDYDLGGVGPTDWDCSGFMSALTNVLRGQPPYARLWNTDSFPSVAPGYGFKPGHGQFTIGNWTAGSDIGHMAGTLAGLNVEATPPFVKVGPDARGANDALFDLQMFLGSGKFIAGMLGAGDVGGVMINPEQYVDKALKKIRIPDPKQGGLKGVNPETFTSSRKALIELVENAMVAPMGDLGHGQAAMVALVKQMAAADPYGWVGAQWNALYKLIMSESGFNPLADNPTSSAFGMFQFLDSTWDDVGGHRTTNPRLQTEYGLKYVRQRYGDPISAWDFHQTNGNYDNGGIVQGPGMVRIGNIREKIAFIPDKPATPMGKLTSASNYGRGGEAEGGARTNGNRVQFLKIVNFEEGLFEIIEESSDTAIAKMNHMVRSRAAL